MIDSRDTMGAAQDRDRAAVAAGLQGAVAASGLSQASFARAVGTSSSRFSTYLSGRTVPAANLYLRSVRLGKALGEAAEYSWMTPVVTVRAVRAALELGDAVWALRMVLQGRDHLRRLLDRGVRAAEAWEADPGSTGAAGWDQLLGALVGREFEARQQQPPAWTFRSAAGGPWLFESPFFDAEEIRAQTPVWLAERGVLIASRDLGTA